MTDWVVPILDPAVDPWRDGCNNSTRGEGEPDGVGIVGLVGDEFTGEDVVEKGGQLRRLGGVPRSYRKPD